MEQTLVATCFVLAALALSILAAFVRLRRRHRAVRHTLTRVAQERNDLIWEKAHRRQRVDEAYRRAGLPAAVTVAPVEVVATTPVEIDTVALEAMAKRTGWE